ncbi:MAG: ribonuclease Z, partial [Candidatus Nitrosotenuis sp.]
IYGPDGIEEFIGENIRILSFGLSFPVMISAIKPGLVCEERTYYVYAEEAEHSVPAYSFLFVEKDRPGRFDVERAKSLGIPEGSLWHDLQLGKEINVGNKTIRPSDVLGQKRAGKKIGISGDTRPTKKLEEFFKNCDYLSFDCTFSDKLKDKALESHHSTAREAATLAKNANVVNLILTHFSARYKDETELLQEARQVHSSVIAAKDLLEIEIK